MKHLYLTVDSRTAITYKHYIGKTLRRLKKGQVIVKKLNLLDPTVNAYRKETVNVLVTEANKKYVTVEVI